MHELGVAESLNRSLSDYIAQNGGVILSAKLRVGRLAGIEPEALLTAWKMARSNALSSCELDIYTPPIEHECRSCGAKITDVSWIIDCPNCQKATLKRVSGQEFLIESIEVENV